MRCPLISLQQEKERSGRGGDLFWQPMLTGSESTDQDIASKGRENRASQG